MEYSFLTKQKNEEKLNSDEDLKNISQYLTTIATMIIAKYGIEYVKNRLNMVLDKADEAVLNSNLKYVAITCNDILTGQIWIKVNRNYNILLEKVQDALISNIKQAKIDCLKESFIKYHITYPLAKMSF